MSTFLTTPRRHRAVLAQLAAVAIRGALIGLIGAGLHTVALAAALPTTDFGFMLSGGGVVRVVAASMFAGMVGAVLGAAIGAVVRNTGGAVTGTFLFLVVAPPLIGRLPAERPRGSPRRSPASSPGSATTSRSPQRSQRSQFRHSLEHRNAGGSERIFTDDAGTSTSADSCIWRGRFARK